MQPLIECRHVSFLAHSEKKIINHISIIIHPGDFVIILGGNGSGKSSFIKLLNRTNDYTHGEILLKKKSLRSYDAKSLHNAIVTMTQFIAESLFLELTVEENAILIDSAYSQKKLSVDLVSYLSQFNKKLSQSLNLRKLL